MKNMRIQIRVGENESLLLSLLERLKERGQGKRGYEVDQLKKMIIAYGELSRMIGEEEPDIVLYKLKIIIEAYRTLAEHVGEADPFKILLKLSSHDPSHDRKEERKEEPQPIKKVNSKRLLTNLDKM